MVSRGVRPPAYCRPKASLRPPIEPLWRDTRPRAAAHSNKKSPPASVRLRAVSSGRASVNSIATQSPIGQSPMNDDLPPPNTRRWVVRRKAAVVVAVRSGRITLEEALRRWQLSEEEYRSWERAFEAHGLPGLRATRLQQYRGPHRPRGPRGRR